MKLSSTRCSYRSGSGEKTDAVIRAIQQDGACWCGGTAWQGPTVMRISVSSWVTTDDDIDKSLARICELADSIPWQRQAGRFAPTDS